MLFEAIVYGLQSGSRGPGFNPCGRREKISVSGHAFLNVFAGMTVNKRAVLQIGTLTEASVQDESPSVQMKEPYSNLHNY